MATNFPSNLDNFTNPTSSDTLDSPDHASQHADVNDAVEALQAKVGVDSSAVTSSLDYKVANQGLTLVKAQTIASNVQSVTVSNVFSSAFDNYKVVINDIACTNTFLGPTISFQFSGSSSGYYGRYERASSSTSTYSSSSYGIIGFTNLTSGSGFLIDIINPQKSAWTLYFGHYYASDSYHGSFHGANQTTSVNTGFTLDPLGVNPSTGQQNAFSGGEIRVYGYNNG